MLFICGCSRSGTSVFTEFLNSHGKLAIGLERYGKRLRLNGHLPPDLFTKARFCETFDPDDSHHKKLLPIYGEMAARFDDCLYIGDKIPNLFLHFDAIKSDYPKAKIIFLLRDIKAVASSHEARAERKRRNPKAGWPLWRDGFNAVKEWNESMTSIQALGDDLDSCILDYNRLYQDESLIEQICAFLNIESTPSFLAFWDKAAQERVEIDAKIRNNLTDEHLTFIEEQADFDLYQNLLNRQRDVG